MTSPSPASARPQTSGHVMTAAAVTVAHALAAHAGHPWSRLGLLSVLSLPHLTGTGIRRLCLTEFGPGTRADVPELDEDGHLWASSGPLSWEIEPGGSLTLNVQRRLDPHEDADELASIRTHYGDKQAAEVQAGGLTVFTVRVDQAGQTCEEAWEAGELSRTRAADIEAARCALIHAGVSAADFDARFAHVYQIVADNEARVADEALCAAQAAVRALARLAGAHYTLPRLAASLTREAAVSRPTGSTPILTLAARQLRG